MSNNEVKKKIRREDGNGGRRGGAFDSHSL